MHPGKASARDVFNLSAEMLAQRAVKDGIEHPTVARIVGELHMDDVPVTHDKREWIKESMEYVEVEKVLAEELKDLVRKARMKASDEQVSKSVKEKTTAWLDKIAEAVRLPEVRNYARPNVQVAVATDEPTGNPEDPEKVLEVEQRDPGNTKGSVEPKGTDRLRTPEKIHERITQVLEIRGKKFRFTHDYKPLGTNASWKEHSMDATKGLEVFTNTEFRPSSQPQTSPTTLPTMWRSRSPRYL